MTAAPPMWVVALMLTASPALSQDQGKAGAPGTPSEKSTENTGFFDDDGPGASSAKKDEKPLDELGDASKATGEGAGRLGAVIGDAAKAALAATPPAQAALASPEVEPQAAPVKREIQAALERGDEPAARQLMGQALKRFPNDPELKDAGSQLWSHYPPEKAHALIESARADAAALFGHQWIPGQTPDDDVVLSIEKGPARGTPMFGRGAATAMAAVKQGYAYLDRGEPAKAEQVLTQALRRHSDSAALYYARVIARGLSGDFKGADGDSLRAITLSREHAVVLSQRACLMMQMGRREEAFAWANRALQGNPQDADALAIRGRYLWKDADRPDAALEDLRRAAQLDPGQYETLYQEGQRRFYSQRAASSMARGDYRQAFINAGLVLNADPGNVRAHLARGLIYWKLGKPEETIKDATLALKSDPRSTWALFHRSLAMESLGRRDFAIADMRRAVAINPRKFQPLLDKLLAAQREGRSDPIWPRESGLRSAADRISGLH